jgi:hypothetical protein
VSSGVQNSGLIRCDCPGRTVLQAEPARGPVLRFQKWSAEEEVATVTLNAARNSRGDKGKVRS